MLQLLTRASVEVLVWVSRGARDHPAIAAGMGIATRSTATHPRPGVLMKIRIGSAPGGRAAEPLATPPQQG
ncbi:hypothetical protein GCM10020221_21760 [Streptomyces thioluteus]|uniref:Uncharacterized protein n=1 Tax=Streptomyces thioluteus TaxID=66431 RepID=A0ABN3WTW5_STRTU